MSKITEIKAQQTVVTLLEMTTEELRAINGLLDTMSSADRIALLEKIAALKGFVRAHVDAYF